jgi:pimeloyl-ACP methyl ester carboxylesterase
VTLGANEVEDLSCLVEFIRAGDHTTTLALWGRSMGAVTSLLYSERDPSVAGLVLDSPFSNLTDLMRELAQEQRIPLWSMVGGTALKLMRRCDCFCSCSCGYGCSWTSAQPGVGYFQSAHVTYIVYS